MNLLTLLDLIVLLALIGLGILAICLIKGGCHERELERLNSLLRWSPNDYRDSIHKRSMEK